MEYWPIPIASVYGIAGYHTGQGSGLDLDGWTFGAGSLLVFPIPINLLEFADRGRDPRLPKRTAFFVPSVDFNWTSNDFRDIEDRVNIYSVTGRLGVELKQGASWFYAYAGPSWQTFDRTQRIAGLTWDVRAKNAVNAVAGAAVGWLPRNESIPGGRDPIPKLALVVEGGMGSRRHILASLRYVMSP